jgi:DNA ligase-1
LAEVEAKGGEGLAVRSPRAPYRSGRSNVALKVKRFDDMEGKVVGYRPGKGRLAGKTGALEVEITGGIRFYIGSGLKNRERERPPPLGSIVTFKHHGFTRQGIPRFASYLRVREGAK